MDLGLQINEWVQQRCKYAVEGFWVWSLGFGLGWSVGCKHWHSLIGEVSKSRGESTDLTDLTDSSCIKKNPLLSVVRYQNCRYEDYLLYWTVLLYCTVLEEGNRCVTVTLSFRDGDDARSNGYGGTGPVRNWRKVPNVFSLRWM